MYVKQGNNPTTYYLTYTKGTDITGQKERYYRTLHDITSRKQLKQEMKRFEREVDDGLVQKTKAGITLYDMCERMLSDYISVGIKETSVRGYRVILDRLKNHRISKAKAEAIQTDDMQKFVRQLQDTKYGKKQKQYSPKTIRNTMSFISNCYDIAITAGLVTHNPCANIRLPKANRTAEKKTLTLNELPVFLQNLNRLDPDTALMFQLALFLGLRRSEVCGIRLQHLHGDWLELVETRHSVRSRGETKTVVSDTKTSASMAHIAIPAFLQVEIADLIKYHEAQKKSLYGAYNAECDYLILEEFGNPMPPDRFNHRLQAYTKSIGIEYVTFHQLRHTYASLVNHFGADIVELASQMRHANPDITLTTYTHLVRSVSDSSRKFAEKMDSFVNEMDGKWTENA